MTTQYWLVKSEPETYSWADLVRDKRTAIYSIWFPAIFVVGGLGIALSSLVRNLHPRHHAP